MIRTLARPMLASVFVIDGVSVLRNPKERASATAPAVSRVAKSPATPAAATQAAAQAEAQATAAEPDALSVNVVRGLAAAKVGAGALFALGKMPRLSATVLAAAHAPTMVARFSDAPGGAVTSTDTKVVGLATDAALLGALFMAAADTQGKPGLKWRYQHARGEVAAALPTIKGEARELKDVLESAAHSIGKDARQVTGVVEEKSHVAAGAMADGIESGLPKLQETAKNLQGQAATALSAASGAAATAAGNLPDRNEVSKRSKKLRKRAAKKRKAYAKNMPSQKQLSKTATGLLGDARVAADDLRTRAEGQVAAAQARAEDAHLQERAQALAASAQEKSGPLLAKVRGFVDTKLGEATARSAEARARAEAARHAAEGDIKAAKKSAKEADKAAKAAAKA